MPRRLGLSTPPGPVLPAGGVIRLLAVMLLALVIAAVPTVTPAAAAESVPVVPPTRSAPDAQLCPEVVVLAARGTAGGHTLSPTRYSSQGPWVSNGYEDATVRAFLQQTERLYGEENGGASLLKDVAVRGLEPWHYPQPENPENPENDEQSEDHAQSREDGRVAETVLQTLLLANRLAHPLTQTVASTASVLSASIGDRPTDGRGAVRAVRDYESNTGCRPDYILIGSGEGAVELAGLERPLAERDSLIGVLHLGAGQPATPEPDSPEGSGGVPGVAGTLLRQLTQSRQDTEPESAGHRLNYCVLADMACGDPAAPQSRSALDYTRWDSAADRKIMQAFASWVDGARD